MADSAARRATSGPVFRPRILDITYERTSGLHTSIGDRSLARYATATRHRSRMSSPTDQQVAQALVNVIGGSKWMAVAFAHGYLALLNGQNEVDAARIVFDRGGATLKRSKEMLQAMKTGGFASQLPLREKTGS